MERLYIYLLGIGLVIFIFAYNIQPKPKINTRLRNESTNTLKQRNLLENKQYPFEKKNDGGHLWKGVSMDWASCTSTQNQCGDYCIQKTIRSPNTLITNKCFVQCGKPCNVNEECPSKCPRCELGICKG